MYNSFHLPSSNSEFVGSGTPAFDASKVATAFVSRAVEASSMPSFPLPFTFDMARRTSFSAAEMEFGLLVDATDVVALTRARVRTEACRAETNVRAVAER